MREQGLYILLFIIVLSVRPYTGYGKPDPTRMLLRAAQEKYQQGQYFEAIPYYEKVLAIDSTQSDAHYYLADCFRYLFEYEKALTHYQQVATSRKANYPLLMLNLGIVYNSLGHYSEAEKLLQQFIQSVTENDEYQYWLKKAEISLAGIRKTQRAPLTPQLDVELSKLPSPVNSPHHDFAATPYQNAHQLLLTSSRNESKGFLYHQQHGGAFSDNFLFSLDSNQWQDQTSLHNFITVNTATDEGPGVLSPDGRYYYFSRFQKGNYQLFVSEFRNEKWHEARLLPRPINLKGYTTKHPALSKSGDTLYFSSDRPGGFGECDIWMSVRRQNTWQTPINLGASVNTPFQETSPHWDEANQVLFFASNGHPGWGGYDLYMAVTRPRRLPQHVVNLGRPLNSSYDDAYIWVNDRSGYITSNRGDSTTGFDVYQYQFIPQAKHLFTINSQSLWKTWAERLLKAKNIAEDEEARLFFRALPSHEKKALKQAVAHRVFQAIQEEYDLSIADIEDARQLNSTHGTKLEWLVKSQLGFLQNFEIISWPEEVQEWYSKLPPEEKARIKKAVRTLIQAELLTLTDNSISESEGFQYELLPSEQQRWLDQTVERGAQQFKEATQEMMDLDLLYQWQTLDPEEKQQLQHQFATRYFAQTVVSEQSPDALQRRYEQLAPEEQSQINQLAHSLLFSTKTSDSLSFDENSFYLQKYSPEEQQSIAQLVVYRAAQMKERYATEVNTDTFQWETLPNEAKNSISRAASYRQFTAQSSTITSLREESLQSINLYPILQSNPEVFTMKGKLQKLSSKSDTTIISFGTANRKVSTTLQPDGSFVFQRVSYQGSPQLFVESSSGSIPVLLALSLEELELVVEQDSQFVASFDNIYFETNKYNLTQEALPALERVVNFHHQHPDVTIQIHAYADSVGSDTFNYELSKRRGKAVYQYMLGQGVDIGAIEIVPKGKEHLNSAQALSYSRRVEFVISGSNTEYNPTRKIYLLSAHPNLEAIASRYQISVEELMSQNPDLSVPPHPYSIIKIVTNQTPNE